MNMFDHKFERDVLKTLFCDLGLKTQNFTKNVWAN